jgi:hypothetical protein
VSLREVCCACRDTEKDVELSTVIFNAYRERYHKLAGIVLGDDRSEDVNDFKQKLSQEELHCASPRPPVEIHATCFVSEGFDTHCLFYDV